MSNIASIYTRNLCCYYHKILGQNKIVYFDSQYASIFCAENTCIKIFTKKKIKNKNDYVK